MKGKFNNGEYKVTIPQNDLSVEVDGFKIIPAMGLGTWIDFASSSDGAMIMGDLVLTENDLKPVQQEIIKQGLTITAIHNHFVRNHPNVMYMHVGGSGNLEQVAQKAKAVLDKIKEVRGGPINCCSVSHLYSVTTPLCKKETIANPLPKTNAPAFVKNHAILTKVPEVKLQKPVPNNRMEFTTEGFLTHFGGAFKNMYKRPAATNNKTSSVCVIIVITNATMKNTQSN
jgi:hypothetical protein